MRVDLTDHAQERIEQRGIAEHCVRKAVRTRRKVGEDDDASRYKWRGVMAIVSKTTGKIKTAYRTEFA